MPIARYVYEIRNQQFFEILGLDFPGDRDCCL